MKRLAYVSMSWEILAVLVAGRRETTSTLPLDAKVEYVTLDESRRALRVYMTSESFALIPEGATVPEFQVNQREAVAA